MCVSCILHNIRVSVIVKSLETYDKRETTPTKYYERIDGLRCIAVSLVLIDHFAYFIGRLFSAGYYGVDLFFVISGFLITLILLKPNEKRLKINYKNFIGRRVLRIFPIYYLTVFILWLLNLRIIREHLIWFVTYTYNYAETPNQAVVHFWSLCVEEQFYVFWPLIVLFLKNKQKLLLLITIIVIVLGYSQMIFDIFPSLSVYNRHGLLTRMSSLGLGALGAVLVTQNLMPDKLFKSLTLEYVVFIVLISSLFLSFKFKALVLGLCSFYLVFKAANYGFHIKPIDRLLKSKRALYIGELSYGIYIFHLPLAYLISTYIFDPLWFRIDFSILGVYEKIKWNSWIIKFPLYTFLSICIASLSYKYIESPILKLKNVFFRY